jgi:hypothetical protein
MKDVLTDPVLAADLVERRRRRAAFFSGDAMASAYLRILDELRRMGSEDIHRTGRGTAS